jgi:hypothetical protein
LPSCYPSSSSRCIPRCLEAQMLCRSVAERALVITPSRKRARPAYRVNPAAPIVPGAADVIANSLRHRSPAFGRSLVQDRQIFAQALSAFSTSMNL